MERDLDTLRNEIDDIDNNLLDLFYKRMDVCREVAEYKKAHNLPVYQEGREEKIFENVRKTAPKGMESYAVSLISSIMSISKVIQQRELFEGQKFMDTVPLGINENSVVGVPGTYGSNSHVAALKIFSDKSIKFYAKFDEVCEAVEKGEVEYGILPIDNTTAGTVIQTYELIDKYNFYINTETKISIEHCLVTRNDVKPEDIKAVYSHPQALSQCSEYIKNNNLKPEEYSNTALAAKMVAESDQPIAAICSEFCANDLGLKIIKKGINDVYPNFTKFICFSKKCEVAEDASRIYMAITLPNTCGTLYKLLTKFYVNNLNMKRIESRPLKDGSFNIRFHIDFDGKMNDPEVSSILNDLRNNFDSFKFMGNYREI